MPLMSPILAGSPRLENAMAGGPSVKKGPPHDNVDAVQRIQRALTTLGFSMPKSFPMGPAGAPDGIFGTETYNTVYAFQKREFLSTPSEWDGRVGKNTLTRMDMLLPKTEVILPPLSSPPRKVTTSSSCSVEGAAPSPAQPTVGQPGIRRPPTSTVRFPPRA